jgi:hypothetical protein
LAISVRLPLSLQLDAGLAGFVFDDQRVERLHGKTFEAPNSALDGCARPQAVHSKFSRGQDK